MDHISPQLSAIQSLENDLPSGKFQELHMIASHIVNNEPEMEEFTSTGRTSRVKPGLLPLVRIIVGIKLKSKDAVLQALRSDDVSVIKQALNAKWFFNNSNELLNVEYIVQSLVPYISMRTRLELIKKLAHCLVRQPEKADDFFGTFADLYGVEQSLPLIVACSEQYIYDAVLERRIVLPTRILNSLYRRYPKVVIRYLHLGNEGNMENFEDRKRHKIELYNYSNFLPVLIKNHSDEFVVLLDCLHNLSSLKIGSTRAEYLLKNNLDLLIRQPKNCMNILPLKIVNNKLTTQQFDTLIENLMWQDEHIFTVVDYLKYYPQEKKLDLLVDKYKKVYGKDLLEQEVAFDLTPIRELLSEDQKEKCGKLKIPSSAGKDSIYQYAEYLPPRKCIPLMKEKIMKPSDCRRTNYLCKMLVSCKNYDSRDDLLEVLKYYNARHKNEQSDVFNDFLNSLTNHFSVETLDKDHWDVLREIVLRGCIKGDFFIVPNFYDTEALFEGAMVYYLKQCKSDAGTQDNQVFLNKLVDVTLELYFKHGKKWSFIVKDSTVEGDCLVKFLTEIPKKYELKDPIWKKDGRELNLSKYLVQSIHEYNLENFHDKTKQGKCAKPEVEGEAQRTKLYVKDYPWLVSLIHNLLKKETSAESRKQRQGYSELRRHLREHDSAFYQKLVDDDVDLIYDVESNDALGVLKKNPCQILIKWDLYVDACRKKLSLGGKATRNFVASTKWHRGTPVKFVEKSLSEIEEKGSIYILGILLEGEALARVVQPYLPKDKHLDIVGENVQKEYELTKSLPKAMNFANPPVSLDVIASFCRGDFTQLAVQTLTSTAQRIPVDRVMSFAKKLVDMPVSVKKHGIRLAFRVSTKAEAREFLSRIWSTETNASIREVLANMIFDTFVQTPDEKTWQLMKICLDGLSFDDASVLTKLVNVQDVSERYVVFYVEAFFTKLDGFFVDTDDDTLIKKKISRLARFVEQIDESIMALMPESLITHMISKYFFHYDVKVVKRYLLTDESKLNERAEVFDGIVREEMKKLGKADPKVANLYPTDMRLKHFFSRLCQELMRLPNKTISREIIHKGLELFRSCVQSSQMCHVYVCLRMYDDYVRSDAPREFGVKFAKTARQIVDEFRSDAILILIIDVVKGLFDILRFHDKVDVVEGLTEGELRVGTIISLKVISRYTARDLGERYYKLMQAWRSVDDYAVQALVNEFVIDVSEIIY